MGVFLESFFRIAMGFAPLPVIIVRHLCPQLLVDVRHHSPNTIMALSEIQLLGNVCVDFRLFAGETKPSADDLSMGGRKLIDPPVKFLDLLYVNDALKWTRLTALRVAELLGIQYTAEELAGLGPPPEPLPGFVTFFDPGLSGAALRDHAVVRERTLLCPLMWYEKYDWSKRQDTPRYRQLRVPVPGSFRRTFSEQLGMLVPDEEVASTRSVSMLLVIHALATGERLLSDRWVRCADEGLDGHRVDVGGFGAYGLIVGSLWDDDRGAKVGVAASRKF
jgi:hypothetical protein